MARKTFNVLFFIKKARLLKNGEAPVCMRITVNGCMVDVLVKRSSNTQFRHDGAAPSLASADRLDGCGVLFSWRTVWGNAARGVGGIQTSAKSRHTAQPREHRLGVPNASNFSRLPLAH